jgi:arsenate reductase
VTGPRRPFRILILCTGNSARSQIAEALLATRGGARVQVESAGSHPAPRVNPLAVARLAEAGIAWEGRTPRGLEGLDREPWDLVVTVCDHAREHCPFFPGRPPRAHWSMEDPAAVPGDEAERRRAFDLAFTILSRRVDRLLDLPLETLPREELERRVNAIPREA